nr:hypothetical protein [Tanacetum cinerariifolium]
MDSKFTFASQTCTLTRERLNQLVIDFDISQDVKVILSKRSQTILDAPLGYVGGVDVPKALHNPITCLGNWKEIDFRSFMLGEVDGELSFLPTEGASEGQNSPSVKSVNNNAPMIDATPLSSVYPSNVENVADDPSYRDDEQTLVAQKVYARASQVAGEASTPLDVDSNSDIHEFPSAKELTDVKYCHWVTLSSLRAKIEGIKSKKESLNSSKFQLLHEIDNLKQDRVDVVSKVISDATMKLICSDDLGFLIAKLVRSSIIYGRCQAFEEVATIEEPFVLEKMSVYRPSSKEDYDQAGDALANASYHFLAEYVANPYASLEQL